MNHFVARQEPAALASLRRSLDSWLKRRGMSEKPRAKMILATHEAVANAIEHADSVRPIIVRAEARGGGDVTIEVSDRGSWKVAEVSDERGRGLTMIHALVCDAQIITTERGTTVRLNQHS